MQERINKLISGYDSNLEVIMEKGEIEEYVSLKNKVEQFENLLVLEAERVVHAVEIKKEEMQDEDEVQELEESLSAWAWDFAYSLGLEFDGTEFWERSTC